MTGFDVLSDTVNVKQWIAENQKIRDRINSLSNDLFKVIQEVKQLKNDVANLSNRSDVDVSDIV
jgi:aspartate/tyrosine/aromatic aminotransferase